MLKKWYSIAIISVIIIATVVGIGSYVLTQKNDSPIEQAAEAVLRTQGIDIDFSPEYD